jgi:Spy/CpxP family protein refolding chaperone
MKNTKARLEAAALFLMVFVLGVAFGAEGNRIWNQRVSGEQAKPTRDQVMQNLTQRLQLTPEQQKQIGAAIDDTRSKWQALETQHEVIRQQFRANVRAILTPEQQVKYEEFLDELRKKEAAKQPGH